MAFSTYQYARFVSIGVANSLQTQYTVPASTQALIKDISACNQTGIAATLTLNMPSGVSLFNGMSIPPNTTVHWTGLVVLGAGEIIQSNSGTSVAIHLIISGQTGQ